jgi:hypothetical protein
MVLSVLAGWLWDETRSPITAFAPAVLCALTIIVLAPTVKHAAIPAG